MRTQGRGIASVIKTALVIESGFFSETLWVGAVAIGDEPTAGVVAANCSWAGLGMEDADVELPLPESSFAFSA